MAVLTVAELMSTRLVTVHPETALARAELEMRVAGFRHLPVVDEGGRLLGILSDRDILPGVPGVERDIVPVRDRMTKPPVTVRPETPAADAVEMLLSQKVSSLPVVDDARRLVGLVTATDFLSIAQQALLGLPVDVKRGKA